MRKRKGDEGSEEKEYSSHGCYRHITPDRKAGNRSVVITNFASHCQDRERQKQLQESEERYSPSPDVVDADDDDKV